MEKYIIKDLIQMAENGKPFYFYGNYSNKQWTNDISEAKYFDSEEDAETALYQDAFLLGMYEIKKIYRP